MTRSRAARALQRVVTVVALSAGLGATAWAAASCAREPQKQPLTQLYTPSFRPPPPPEPASATLTALRASLDTPEGQRFVRSLLPDQAGLLWLSLLVAIVVALDVRAPWNPRNVDLVAMLAIGACFFDITRFLRLLDSPTWRNLMDWVFLAVGALTTLLLIRAVWRARYPPGVGWRPNLDGRVLAVLALLLLCLNVAVALAYPPDDAGYYVNIGAQRLREQLRFPYGDPLLTATPAAAYGPVLYLAHLPFQWLLAPTPVNPASLTRPIVGPDSPYFLPPLLATQLCTVAFHLAGVAALFVIGRRRGGSAVGWALVALYCGSACVLGVGGSDFFIGGMTFVSHIAPACVTLIAFAALGRPALSGGLLAASVGVLFYPIFMVPAWLGFYWRRRADALRFVAGFAVVALVVGGAVLGLSQATEQRGRIATILYDTLGHQESPAGYGSSPFGLWGQREGLRHWLMHPLAEGQAMTRPVVLAFFAFAAAAFFLARGRSEAQFALVVAALAMGAQLWKVHATATYVAWYYPFLLIGLYGSSSDRRESPSAD